MKESPEVGLNIPPESLNLSQADLTPWSVSFLQDYLDFLFLCKVHVPWDPNAHNGTLR